MEVDGTTGIPTIQRDDAHAWTRAVLPGMAGRHDPGSAETITAFSELETEFPSVLNRDARQGQYSNVPEKD
jgi:hypothetical protein